MFQNGQLTVLNMRDILPNRFQPRIRFDEEKLEELADSISKYGVIQPIVVRPVGSRFEIIAGERRFKASKLASRSTIPAIVVNLSDKDSEEIALLENVQRQELSPIEEAVSYKRILDMGYITQEQLAQKIGKAQSTIANKIRLLNLDDEVQSYLLNNKISERHARSLLRIPDKEKQVEMLHRIVEERLTVKQTDKEIEKLKESMKVVKPVELNIPVKEASLDTNSQSEEIENLFDDENEGGNNMDIDKIMREAKDINNNVAPEPKDISNLMVPGSGGVEPVVQPEPVPQPAIENVEAKRFINTVPQAEPTAQVQEPSNTVTFDSMFNQSISPTPEKAVMEAEKTIDNSQPTVALEDNNLSSMAMPTATPSVMPVQEAPVADQSEPAIPEVSNDNQSEPVIPEVSNVVNDFASTPNIYTQSQTDSVSNVSSEEISTDTRKAISTAVASALKKYNDDKARQSLANTIPTPVADVVSMPEADSTSKEVNIPDTNIIAGDTLSEYANKSVGVQSSMASTISQDVKPVNNQSGFVNIVKLLRDCADKIEQSGYFVNMDELDLGNQYRVTFTINKE